MNVPRRKWTVCSQGSVSSLALALAATACSGEYPLGSASSSRDLVADEASGEVTRTGDASLPPVLPRPSVTIGVDDFTGPATLAPVGDLDGDGYGDTAQTSWDIATGASWVHIRYGGPRPRDAVEALAFDREGAYLAVDPPYLGASYLVFGAGDVDADGFDDLLLKSIECEVIDAQGPSGAFLVYGGPERFDGTLSLTSVSSHFVAPAYPDTDPDADTFCSGDGYAFGPGDIDGDGIDDFVITFGAKLSFDFDTATLSASYAAGEGVYIYYGSKERFPSEVPLAAGAAVFRVDEFAVNASAIGDVNGDGLADIIMAGVDYEHPTGFLLPGRTERWVGSLDLPTVATQLPGVLSERPGNVFGPRDIDGDEIDDLLFVDQQTNATHLFYGRPGLFAEGFDFAASDAVIPLTERSGVVFSGGDLDGDGDAELLDQFLVSPELPHPTDIALLSGSRARLAGEIAFPLDEVAAASPDGPYPGIDGRFLSAAIPAGDLDGDGADDLFTVSELRFDVQESSYDTSTRQVHVHYGTKADLGESPR